MARQTLALDIKNRGIDWVLLRAGLRDVQIVKSGHLVCQASNGDTDSTVATLQELHASLELPGLTCVAAIEGHGLMTRSLAVPFQDRRKVRQILPLELESTLPVAVENLAVDFQMADNGSGRLALSVAMAREQVEFYLQILRDAGLDPVLVTFAGLPSAMLLAASVKGEKTILLIDGDTDHTTFFLIVDHQLRYLRSWTPPRTPGDPSERLKLAIDQTTEAVAEIYPDMAPIGKVFLTSRGARHYPPEKLATALERAVAVFDPGQSARPTVAGELAGGYGQGALALGLYEPMADKGLNLFRAPFPLRRLIQQHRRQFVRTAVLAAVLAGLFLAGVLMDIQRNEQRVRALRNEAETILRETFPTTRNIADPLKQMHINLREARANEPASRLGAQEKKIDILHALSRSLPPQLDIHVSQLVAGMERVQISGTTGTFEAVNEAKEHLEKAALFGEITILSANMDPRAGRVRFRLSAELQGERGP